MQGSSKIPFVRLVEKFEANLLCPHCEVICTADSRHCYICDQCVERFDHHCQWVNNCIGINNHSYFYLFIILQDIYLVLVLIMSILSKSRTSSFTPSHMHVLRIAPSTTVQTSTWSSLRRRWRRPNRLA